MSKFMDTVINQFLNARSYVAGHLKLRGSAEPDVRKMKLVFYDDFRLFRDDRWHVGQFWGRFHPDYPYQYYDARAITVDEHGLNLSVRYQPSTETHYSLTSAVTIPYAVGLVVSYPIFGYGFYRFELSLPSGPGLWPAIWLTGSESWPPEIDVIEAYSDCFSNYGSRFETNLHFGISPEHRALGAMAHPVLLKQQHRVTVSCHWTATYIRFYYNGFLVRRVTDPRILKWFQCQTMRIVLNNGLRPETVDFLNQLVQHQPELQKKNLFHFKIHRVEVWV